LPSQTAPRHDRRVTGVIVGTGLILAVLLPQPRGRRRRAHHGIEGRVRVGPATASRREHLRDQTPVLSSRIRTVRAADLRQAPRRRSEDRVEGVRCRQRKRACHVAPAESQDVNDCKRHALPRLTATHAPVTRHRPKRNVVVDFSSTPPPRHRPHSEIQCIFFLFFFFVFFLRHTISVCE